MTLIDFILPKWRHSNPEVRIAAVREMTSEKLDTLERMALADPEAAVRTEAIGRIDDAGRLEAIIDRMSDDAMKQAAQDRLNRLYHDRLMAAADQSERIGLLEKLTDEERLAAVAAEMEDPDIRMAALTRIHRPAVLCRVAERHCGPAVGGEVVTRLDDPDLLKRLARTASNKKVRKQAEDKLKVVDRREKAEPAEDALAACCVRLETLLADGAWTEYPAALADAAAIWETHDPDGRHPLRARFQEAADAIETQLKTFQRKGEVQSAMESLCVEAEALADGPASGDPSPETFGDRIASLQRKWAGIDLSVAPPTLRETLSTRFETACRRAESEGEQARAERADAAVHQQERLDALDRLCQTAEALAAPVADPEGGGGATAEWDALRATWEGTFTGDPSEGPLRDRFESAWEGAQKEMAEAARRAAEAVQAQEARLHALCEAVEAAVEAEDRAGLEKTVRAAQAEWKATGDRIPEVKTALADRFGTACDRFFQVQREFWEKTEWERWANLTRKEELCVIVEALADAETTEGLPEMVREVRNRWKSIGPVSREKAEPVRERFRTACDVVYARCLSEKEALAVEARDLVQGVPESVGLDSASEWEQVSDALKSIQARWKAIGALPRFLEKPLFEAFQSQCNEFFERRRDFYQTLDAERKANLARKTTLCKEAASLSESTDWGSAAARLKELQREWKAVGPVPREDADRLWHRFQSACNRFFDRLEAAKPDHLALKQALCERVESLTADLSDDELMKETAQKIMALQEEWKAIGPVPEEAADDLWERFRAPCDRFFVQYRDHVQEIRSRREENREQKEAVAAEAESLAGSDNWKETGDRLKTLQKEWREIGPAPRRAEGVLWDRFRSACDAFFTRRNEHFASLDRKRAQNLQKKEDICLRLEVLAQLAAPNGAPNVDASDRAAERVRVGLEYKDGVIVPDDRKTTWENVLKTVRRLQAEWKDAGSVRSEDHRRLWRRYRRAVEAFFPPRPAAGNEESAAPRPPS